MPKIVGGKFGDLFDFRYLSEREYLLPIVTARHLIILFHAFPNLQKLDNEIKKKIIDYFVDNNVLEVQGWKVSKTELGAPITKDHISSEMHKYADLSGNKYRMKTTAEITALRQPQNIFI